MILKELWDARSDWYNIGLELNVVVDKLNAIHVDNRGQSDQCLRSVIQTYLSDPYCTKSWSEIIRALKSPTVNYGFLADILESKFLSVATLKSGAEAATPGIYIIDIVLMLHVL